MNIPKLVIESFAEMKNKKAVESVGFENQRVRTVARLDDDTTSVFSAVWTASAPIIAYIKNKEYRDWIQVRMMYQEKLKELQPTLDDLKHEIVIYEAFRATIEAVVTQIASKQLKYIQQKKELRKPEHELSHQLKQIYIDYQGDRYCNFDTTTETFFESIVVPICDALPSMNSFFLKIDADTFEVSSQYPKPKFKQYPDMSSLPNLFEQGLNVHEIVVPDAIDANRGGMYNALVARGIWKGGYEEFELEHPKPSERKKQILHELLHTVESALKLKAGVGSQEKLKGDAKNILKTFEKFLKTQDRFYS